MPTDTAATLDTTWLIDPDRSTVGFTIAHLKFATVTGRFREFAGTLATDERGALRATGVVLAGTLDTGNALRDRRVRGAEFLDADRHPEIRFASRVIERVGGGDLRITGDLTIRDTTREFELRTRIGAATDDRLALTVSGELSRAAFGIDSIELNAAGISDTLKFAAELSLSRRLA